MGRILRSLNKLMKFRAAYDSRQRRVAGPVMNMGDQLKLMGRFGQELVLETRN